ncbi:hypothetical protein [Bdellovibrio sp. HCB209]|uniref:hypothetical protein n=1 Tax=Bdellovibrio sp. HCB209 TaxID=3394354 RepID=UPI0039B4D054
MKILIWLFVFLSAVSAQAEIYLEPYLGYSTGSGTGSNTEQGSPPISTTGTNTSSQLLYGARAGWTNKTFAAGAEFETGNMSFKNTDNLDDGSSTTTEESTYEARMTALGVFGLIRAGKFNIYATYFPSFSIGDRNGSGSKIGIGYQTYKSIYVNFEMMGTTINEFGDVPANMTNLTFAHNLMTLSASVPLTL